jgi:hypothetical protein
MQTQSYMQTQYVNKRVLGNSLVTTSSTVDASLIESNNQDDLLGVSFTNHSAFQLQKSNIRKSRWVAHVSCNTKLASSRKLVLNIKPTQTTSAFDILERLLFSKTCAVIYSDETLPLHQVQMLKQMASFSGTEVIFIANKTEFNLLQLDDLEKA